MRYVYLAEDSNGNLTVRISVSIEADGDIITAKVGRLQISVPASLTPEKCAIRAAQAKRHLAHKTGVDESGWIANRSLASKQEEAIFDSLGKFLSSPATV